MGRIMAIDYGDARTGIALSDLTGSIAGETLTIQEWNAERLAQRIAYLAQEKECDLLLLGLPKNMDGTEGPRAEKARAFAEMLKTETGMSVLLRDERRTTIEAHSILHANGKKEKKHRNTVDAVAATLILESYLGQLKYAK